MPPVLDPSQSKVDGLAFIGLSLQRHHPEVGHPDSSTHQTAWDLNRVLDRDYEHVFSTNDDGWLVGGGEPGPPHSYKLKAPDSAHVEIIRLGTFRPEWGGVDRTKLLQTLSQGVILIPDMQVVPTAVVANGDLPPEVEIRFDIPDEALALDPDRILNPSIPLPVNWQLRFVHNQCFKEFVFASRFCPGPFHSTICRKVEWRSDEDRAAYFRKCDSVVAEWRRAGVQPLEPDSDIHVDHTTGKVIQNLTCQVVGDSRDDDDDDNDPEDVQPSYDSQVGSGLWLFVDRSTISHRIWPNFLPPYNTPAKRKIIWQVLSERWDDHSLNWKKVNVTKEMAIQTSNSMDQPAQRPQGLLDSLTDHMSTAFCRPVT